MWKNIRRSEEIVDLTKKRKASESSIVCEVKANLPTGRETLSFRVRLDDHAQVAIQEQNDFAHKTKNLSEALGLDMTGATYRVDSTFTDRPALSEEEEEEPKILGTLCTFKISHNTVNGIEEDQLVILFRSKEDFSRSQRIQFDDLRLLADLKLMREGTTSEYQIQLLTSRQSEIVLKKQNPSDMHYMKMRDVDAIWPRMLSDSIDLKKCKQSEEDTLGTDPSRNYIIHMRMKGYWCDGVPLSSAFSLHLVGGMAQLQRLWDEDFQSVLPQVNQIHWRQMTFAELIVSFNSVKRCKHNEAAKVIWPEKCFLAIETLSWSDDDPLEKHFSSDSDLE